MGGSALCLLTFCVPRIDSVFAFQCQVDTGAILKPEVLMNSKHSWRAVRMTVVLTLATATGGLAQTSMPTQFSGVIHDYSPSTTVTPMGPWEMRGTWVLTVDGQSGKGDFSAALTMELSDYTRNPSNVDSVSGADSRMQHTHNITIQGGTVTQIATGGFELTGPVSITKDGSPAPLAASTLSVSITGGKTVEFSNITLQFQGGAPVHFGPQSIHGVVVSPKPGCQQDAAPVLATVTDSSYGAVLSGKGTILVWGQGFSQSGGNTLVFQRSGYLDVAFNVTDGLYYWDLAAGQINASLGGLLAPGTWTLTVHSACSSTPSNSLSVTIN
jgi:hypothetical protein